jgi:hypothetical protein
MFFGAEVLPLFQHTVDNIVLAGDLTVSCVLRTRWATQTSVASFVRLLRGSTWWTPLCTSTGLWFTRTARPQWRPGSTDSMCRTATYSKSSPCMNM